MDQSTISIKCLEITQPIGSFYIGVMNYDTLMRISYADIRKIADRDLDTYLGIQRTLSPSRVEEIGRYVNSIDATFPTSIILAISSEDATFDPRTGIMEIRNSEEVAKIIDGQHRIEGLKYLKGNTFQLNVTIFVDMDIEDQAMVFATINLAQTKVSKSLVYDLYEYTTTRSPQKTSHNITKLLNSREGSPFYRRIKILGKATEKYQTLTQAAFVESLLRLISGSIVKAEEDRELLRRKKKPPRASSEEVKNLVFRNMFLDEKDADIAKVLWNYFEAVRMRWPMAWEGVDTSGNMLPRTNGFRALMRLIPLVYIRAGKPGEIPSVIGFHNLFRKITLKDEDFKIETYPPGTSGESKLLNDFRNFIEVDHVK